ncbi:MAG: type II toxin-antitoxin system VapC family toxin [Pseudomonadota bacterium]
MKLLLDTQVVLWAATIPDELRTEARDLIEDGTQDVLVSVVSAWEIALKQSLGKLELPSAAERWLPEVLRRSGFELAEVGFAAALKVRALPWHHRDPFDRLLVAQALEEGYTLVTRNEALSAYGVPILTA